MDSILIVGIIIFTGFIFGEIAIKFRIPKVTGYILAGIFLNPGLFKIVPEDFVDHTGLITNLSLSLITFSVGGVLLYSRIKKQGKAIIYITIFEAQAAFIAVAAGFMIVAPFFLHLPGSTWLTTIVPVSLLIAALASPTDPSATLAVAHEYKAKGAVSSTIMGAAAFDDALGIINYSLATIIAGTLISHEVFSVYSSLIKPLIVIGGAVFCGISFGILFNKISSSIRKQTEGVLIVLIAAFLSLCFGVAAILGFDELLATMTMGIVVVNFNDNSSRIFAMLERYTEELVFVLFFTLSGMHLNFRVLMGSLALVLLFVFFRVVGKIVGTGIGAALSQAPSVVKKYTAWGLIPQGGIVIGLALMMKQDHSFDAISDIIISVTIGASVIHELIGPLLAKMALEKAGEIKKGEY
ncbi:MAG: sodium:proton exchanger, partial [Candidatus Omnitrophica bacterium CG11_big_fil_rev_8_21_14_0_20_42_13]